MSGNMLAFRSERVITPEGEQAAAVLVRDGRIEAVVRREELPAGCAVVEAGDAVLLPGLVDTHVHVNEPGRGEWEGFASATRAAAAGGVTTLVDMPLNSIPAVTTVPALERKVEAARGRCTVDVGFWGGVVPGNAQELGPLHAAGVLGFKCFLSPSGVDEFGEVDEGDLREAMPILAALGAPLLVHAEHPAPLARARREVEGADPRAYGTFLRSRPREAEQAAIELLIRLCAEYGTRVHVVHLSSADALPALSAARAAGLPITVESCPHYLHFAAEEVPDGATGLKCAPPIRERENRERLWAGLADGEIDLIASDHSPCPPALKSEGAGDFHAAWGGIASLQLGVAVVWRGARERGHGPARIAEWMSAAPARLAGLAGRKGAIAAGHDADLSIWDPTAEWEVDPTALHHRHPLTPYGGEVLPGAVRATYLRGRLVYEDGLFPAPPVGRTILRSHA